VRKNPEFSVISVSAETDKSETSGQFYHLPLQITHIVCFLSSGDVVLLAVNKGLKVCVRELGELVGPTCVHVLGLELLGPARISFWQRK
jgi:hypothetical protein